MIKGHEFEKAKDVMKKLEYYKSTEEQYHESLTSLGYKTEEEKKHQAALDE